MDFQVSRDYVWALWTNSEGLPVVRYAAFSSTTSGLETVSGSATAQSATDWVHAALEEPLYPESLLEGGGGGFDEDEQECLRPMGDPRQTYIREIFKPGRFSMQTLAKTISVTSFGQNIHLESSEYCSNLRSTAVP